MQSNCPTNHPKRQPLFLLLALSLIAAAPAGKEAKTMNSIAVEQLGTVSPRQSVGSWRGNEAVEPMPIVQWQNGEVGMAFVHEWKTNSILGSFKETITPIKTAAQGKLSSDYPPIRFSAHVSNSRGERGTAAFDLAHHVAADLTGNGSDQLILPRHQGGLDVYGSQGKIASWTAPGHDEAYYANDVVLVHKAKQGNRELVYVVYRSEAYSDAKIPDAVASAHASRPVEMIAEVSLSGIRTIPVLGLPGPLVRILGLAYFVPASGQPEMVVCSRVEVGGKEQAYLSRHRFDGSPIASPRQVYVNLGAEPRMEFVTFQAGDPYLIAVGNDSNLTAFVWPEKEVNWFKTINFESAWRMGESTLFKGVVDRKSGRPKVLFQKGSSLFVRDDDGVCYRLVGNRYVAAAADEIEPWQEIKPTSQYHRLAQIRLLEGDDDAVLVLEVRRSGRKKLTLEEARAAAEKFLAPEFVAKTEKKYGFTFENMMKRANDGDDFRYDLPDSPNPQTLEDIARIAPRFYKFHSELILSNLHTLYERELLAPVSDYRPAPLEGPRYHDIPQFKQWLEALHFAAAIQLRVLGRSGLLANHTLEPATIYTTSPAPGIPMSWVVAKRAGERLNVVLPMVFARGDSDAVGMFQLRLK
jgi:hypothetical protein